MEGKKSDMGLQFLQPPQGFGIARVTAGFLDSQCFQLVGHVRIADYGEFDRQQSFSRVEREIVQDAGALGFSDRTDDGDPQVTRKWLKDLRPDRI